jgi:hypothetical protein
MVLFTFASDYEAKTPAPAGANEVFFAYFLVHKKVGGGLEKS